MGLFGKKKEVIEKIKEPEIPEIPERTEEEILKEELEAEVEKLQNEFRIKQQSYNFV